MNTKQDELHIQVQKLTQECERLKQEKEQRQALSLQLQQLQAECEHLRKRQEESECERLKEESQRQALSLQLQQLQSECEHLRKRQEEICNVSEKGDAEDASQPDSSWELCTLMSDSSGIIIDTAGRCFMTDAVFKASEVFCLGSEIGSYRPYEIFFVPPLNK